MLVFLPERRLLLKCNSLFIFSLLWEKKVLMAFNSSNQLNCFRSTCVKCRGRRESVDYSWLTYSWVMFTYIYNIIVLKFKIDFPNLCNLKQFFRYKQRKKFIKTNRTLWNTRPCLFYENCNTVHWLVDCIGITTIFFSQCSQCATKSECHRSVKLFCT